MDTKELNENIDANEPNNEEIENIQEENRVEPSVQDQTSPYSYSYQSQAETTHENPYSYSYNTQSQQKMPNQGNYPPVHHGRPPHGNPPPHGRPPHGRPPHGNPPPHGRPPHGNPPQHCHQPPYGAPPQARPPYGRPNHAGAPVYGQQAPQNPNYNYPPVYNQPNAAYGQMMPYAQKSKLIAGLLGILLGAFGVHNFYLGFTTKGVIQIILSILTLGVAGIWGFIEGVLYLTGSMNTDSNGIPLKE